MTASGSHDLTTPLAIIHVSRGRAFTRGLLWLAPAILVGTILRTLVFELWMGETGLRSWLVNLSLIVVVLPVPVIFLILIVSALRWLLLAMWPTTVGFIAFDDRLEVRLGPFGSHRYGLTNMNVRYFFELDDEEGDGGFEAYLPEEEQMEKYLPRMHHPRSTRSIHESMMRFATGSEADLAAIWQPATRCWRAAKGLKNDGEPETGATSQEQVE